MRITGYHTIDDSIAIHLNILALDHLKTRNLDGNDNIDFENEIKALEPIASLYLNSDQVYHYSKSILLYVLKLKPFRYLPNVENIDEEGFRNFLLSIDTTSRLWKHFHVGDETPKYDWESFVRAMCKFVFKGNTEKNSDSTIYTEYMIHYISIIAEHHYWVEGFKYLLDLHKKSRYLIELQNAVLSFSL